MSRKRVADDIENIMPEDDDSPGRLILACTPSGKVRRLKSGTPVRVIRKSYELKRLKTTEEKVEALRNSPMVEFRRKSCGVLKSASPLQTPEQEKERQRRDSLCEMRADIMEKLSADYSESPPKRDANSARKLRRKSRQLEEELVTQSEATGKEMAVLSAQHFRDLLMDETSRLTELRTTWDALYMDAAVPVHAQAEIAVVIGKTDLLFRHKFFFFESLISQHEEPGQGRPVTVQDLLGFWETMGLEVANVTAGFERLARWRARGWEGDVDAPKAAARPRPARPKAQKKEAAPRRKEAKSRFAEFRAKLQETQPRSALKSGRREPRAVGAVRFSVDDSERTTPSRATRRPPTPAARVTRSSRPSMPSSPSTPQSAGPSSQRTDSRRRIADIRSSAGLTLRTAEARRKSKSCSPPVSARTAERTRQSSVRFADDSPESEGASVQMPVTPYNQASLVPMARRSRNSSSAGRQPKDESGSRVRFDATASSPPAGTDSAPVTPFNRNSLAPMPRKRVSRGRARDPGQATPRRSLRHGSGDSDANSAL